MARTHPRAAYTLLELMLVMAILVIMGAVFYPSLDSSYGYYKVTGAADAVKGAWAQARARAIEDGIPYRFAVVTGTNKYRVAPDQPEFWSGGKHPDTADGDSPPLVLDDVIPNGIKFESRGIDAAYGGGNNTSGTTGNDSSGAAASADTGPWTTITLFLPDGTARDDVSIQFKEDKGSSSIKIKLRSLTGTVKTISGKEAR